MAPLITSLPVRLVADDDRAADAASVVHLVDPGLALPGIRSLRVTSVHRDGGELLAAIEPERATAAPAVTLAELLETLTIGGAVPVLVRGTPFTRAVLEALLRVPAGRRITYAALAAAAGRPGAVRAAASVMARNRVPLVLPCHRVVPSGGGVGRYAWGDAVKAALLAAESERAAA